MKPYLRVSVLVLVMMSIVLSACGLPQAPEQMSAPTIVEKTMVVERVAEESEYHPPAPTAAPRSATIEVTLILKRTQEKHPFDRATAYDIIFT